MHDTNERTKHLLKQKINEVLNKGDISPSEMECIEEAYETLSHIATIEAMENYDYNEESYRRGNRSMRNNYDGRSYGYDGWDVEDMSMRRGRGADGRYVSREGNYNQSYTNDGNSRHSVNDRIIANLEKELDYASSDFERQKIMDEIRRIREMKD